ncbi:MULTISPECIES: hypothetical protein [unclassified Streptomyces]|uniref:hypothetical protein n=1 Tax=unclassified Streptomyces TaxID=2593676 RepID=UPI00324A655D
MKRSHALAAGVLLLVSGSAAAAQAADSSDAPARTAGHTVSAARWCEQQGGHAVTRVPYYATAGGTLSPLGGEREMCVFTDTKKKTKIMISADSLASKTPTLAALAYVRKPAGPSGPGNPSVAYCQGINGTAMFGNRPTDSGGWGPEGATSTDQIMGTCMFADGSVIDAWGLKYHQGGVIRGADLTEKFRADIP